jgi:hypothetical protein
MHRGKFGYRRAPHGYLLSGDSFSRHTDAIMEDCPSMTSDIDFEKIVDDIITHSDTVEGAFERIYSIQSHCNQNGLVFNAEKFRLVRREVEFTGFMITEDGIKPTAKYTTSIRDFRTPRNISKV